MVRCSVPVWCVVSDIVVETKSMFLNKASQLNDFAFDCVHRAIVFDGEACGTCGAR